MVAAGRRGREEVLENGPGRFGVHIEGLPVTSAAVESVTMEDLVIDEREITERADWNYRVYGPGDAHYGSITIRSRVGTDSTELYGWWLDASQGKDVRKSITISLLARDGSEARRYTFSECFPTRYAPHHLQGERMTATETVVVQCRGVTFDGKGRRELLGWLNEILQGKSREGTVVLRELNKDGTPGRTFTYLDSFPVRYVFPSLSVGETGDLYEEVQIKPIRLELEP